MAREFGVPGVVGVDNATEILKDGQKIAIDGETGEVYAE
jgi:pyruvate,water dikinase